MLCFVQRTCPRVLRFGTWNQSETTQYIWKLCTSYFGRPSPTVGLSERGLNLGCLTCNRMAMCYVLCRELLRSFEVRNVNPIWNDLVYTDDFTCSLIAICYVLFRVYVLRFGVWNLLAINSYIFKLWTFYLVWGASEQLHFTWSTSAIHFYADDMGFRSLESESLMSPISPSSSKLDKWGCYISHWAASTLQHLCL